MLRAGEGRIDITPPNGVELAGFHKPVGQERKVEGVRQAPFARALVVEVGDQLLAVLSIDLIGVSRAFSAGVKGQVAKELAIPEAHVLVCATHTHSMPTFVPLLQWGAVPDAYMAEVLDKCVQAIAAAKADLAEADLYYGQQRVIGGNHNRTVPASVPAWKTDADFTGASTHDERWLDTVLQVLYFQRSGPRSLQWYHFCAHPVCFGDALAGPDWPGLVSDQIQAADGFLPSFLNGHIGDVNPGDGTPWIGDPQETLAAVAPALHHATGHGEVVEATVLRVETATIEIPLDIPLLQEQLELYKTAPEKCVDGEWVDAGFAKAWYDQLSQWDMSRTTLATPVTAVRLGDVYMLFHPSELYSFYGLKLRLGSKLPRVFVVGYCDDVIGYLTDPMAYDKREYAAVVVPKILGLPPFTQEAAESFTNACAALMAKLT